MYTGVLGAGPVLEALARCHVSNRVFIEIVGDGNDLIVLVVFFLRDLLLAVLIELA